MSFDCELDYIGHAILVAAHKQWRKALQPDFFLGIQNLEDPGPGVKSSTK